MPQEVTNMNADRLSQDDRMEASRQAQNIQKTVNATIGRRFVRCVAPMKFIRSPDISVPGDGARYGVELRVEPLVTITDFRDQPGRRLAATLREWADQLTRAAASLEG
jgi:hypothetical protein